MGKTKSNTTLKKGKKVLKKFESINKQLSSGHFSKIAFQLKDEVKERFSQVLDESGNDHLSIKELKIDKLGRKCLKYEPIIDEAGNITGYNCILWQ
jgi:hypothetical protein